MRLAADARRLVAGADVLVHAAAALPIQVTRDAIRSVNVEGTAVTLGAALEAGVRRVVLISSTAVYGVPETPPDPRGRPARRRRPLRRVEDRGGGALRRVRATRARHGDRAAEDVRRAGAPRGVRDPLRLDPRGPPDPDPRRRHEPVPAPCGRGPRRGGRPLPRRPGRRGGAQRRRGAVRHGARGSRGARRARRLRVTAPSRSRAARPSWRCAASSSRGSRRSRSGTTGRRTRTPSSRSTRRATLLGWEPRLSNAETLCATYDWYLAHRAELGAAGTTHRVPWDQRALGVLRRLS